MVFALPTWVSVIIIIGVILYATRKFWKSLGIFLGQCFAIILGSGILIAMLPFVLIRDFIYRVILDRTIYTGLTFLKPRNDRERRIKKWIERKRRREKIEKARAEAREKERKEREERQRRLEENLRLKQERWRREYEYYKRGLERLDQ